MGEGVAGLGNKTTPNLQALGNGQEVTVTRSKTKLEFRNMQIANHQHVTKVFKCLQLKLNTKEDMMSMKVWDTDVLIWELFMTTTMKAAMHFGPDCAENWEHARTQNSNKCTTCSLSVRN